MPVRLSSSGQRDNVSVVQRWSPSDAVIRKTRRGRHQNLCVSVYGKLQDSWGQIFQWREPCISVCHPWWCSRWAGRWEKNLETSDDGGAARNEGPKEPTVLAVLLLIGLGLFVWSDSGLDMWNCVTGLMISDSQYLVHSCQQRGLFTCDWFP